MTPHPVSCVQDGCPTVFDFPNCVMRASLCPHGVFGRGAKKEFCLGSIAVQISALITSTSFALASTTFSSCSGAAYCNCLCLFLNPLYLFPSSVDKTWFECGTSRCYQGFGVKKPKKGRTKYWKCAALNRQCRALDGHRKALNWHQRALDFH